MLLVATNPRDAATQQRRHDLRKLLLELTPNFITPATKCKVSFARAGMQCSHDVCPCRASVMTFISPMEALVEEAGPAQALLHDNLGREDRSLRLTATVVANGCSGNRLRQQRLGVFLGVRNVKPPPISLKTKGVRCPSSPPVGQLIHTVRDALWRTNELTHIDFCPMVMQTSEYTLR